MDTDEVNINVDGLLELFYTGTLTNSLMPINATKTEPIYPTVDDNFLGLTSEIDERMRAQENELQRINSDLRGVRDEAVEYETMREQISAQIEILEEEIGLITKKLELEEEQVAYWQNIITNLTMQRSTLRSLYRATKRDKERLLLGSLLSTNSLQNSAGYGWFFSDDSLGEILEEQRLHEILKNTHEQKLIAIAQAHSDIDAREENAGKILQKTESLATSIASQRQNLSDLITAKASLTQQLEQDNVALTQKIETFVAEQQAVKNQILELQSEQNFRESLMKTIEELREELRESQSYSGITRNELEDRTTFDPEPEVQTAPDFVLPLEGDMTVTAGYHDAAYEESFGQVHEGVDFYAPQGTTVFAVADGVVQQVIDGGLGYSYIIVAHEFEMFSVYGHLSGFAVEEGDAVTAGQPIARSGGTPGTRGAGFFTTGPHLHIELWQDGTYVDPLQFLPSIEKDEE